MMDMYNIQKISLQILDIIHKRNVIESNYKSEWIRQHKYENEKKGELYNMIDTLKNEHTRNFFIRELQELGIKRKENENVESN